MDRLSLQFIVVGVLLALVLASSLIYFFLVQRMSRNRHYEENQRLLLELRNRELTVGFEERELMMTEVSKELHDNIGQIVHLIRMHLYVIEEKAVNTEQLKLIRYVSGLADQMISDTNHISHSLNSDFIKKRGLDRMLEDDLEHIKTATNIACYLHVEGDNNFLEPEKQLWVYRIAQQATHNALKHAHAGLLEINLSYTDQKFTMHIHDNGTGFDMEQVKEKGTMGLANMQERAKLLNGNLAIKTAPAEGCIISLFIENPVLSEPLLPSE